jgi:hypothetical protein
MIHPSELVLNLIEVYEIGNGVSMRIGTAVASIIYPNMVCLSGESMGVNPKIAISSHISLQNAFKNPMGRLFKLLFPLGHKNYLPPVIIG